MMVGVLSFPSSGLSSGSRSPVFFLSSETIFELKDTYDYLSTSLMVRIGQLKVCFPTPIWRIVTENPLQ